MLGCQFLIRFYKYIASQSQQINERTNEMFIFGANILALEMSCIVEIYYSTFPCSTKLRCHINCTQCTHCKHNVPCIETGAGEGRLLFFKKKSQLYFSFAINRVWLPKQQRKNKCQKTLKKKINSETIYSTQTQIYIILLPFDGLSVCVCVCAPLIPFQTHFILFRFVSFHFVFISISTLCRLLSVSQQLSFQS